MFYPPSQTQQRPFLCAGLFLVSLAFFAFLSSNALINGDAALYQQQIVNFDFAQRTVHLGYYLLGSPFIHMLPLPDDYALNLMNCFFGALCSVLIYLTALAITQNHRAALLSVTVLLTNYLFVVNAAYAEVYLPQLFFFLLAIQLVLRERSIPAGVSFALSFLVTPSALFGLPFLLLLQRDRRAMVQLTTTALLLVLPAILPRWDDYYGGGRGILKAVSTGWPIQAALAKEAGELFTSMLCYAPFLLAGVLYIVRTRRLHRFGAALLSLWFCSFIFGEKFGDVPVQLPTYVLLSPVVGLGVIFLLGLARKRSAHAVSALYLFIILAVGITGFFTIRRMAETTRSLNEYRTTVLAIDRSAHPDYLVLGGWSQGILFEHYVLQRSYTGVWINTEWLAGDWGEAMHNKSRAQLERARSSGREMWLLDADPSPLSALSKQGYVIEPFRNFYRARKQMLKDGAGHRDHPITGNHLYPLGRAGR